MYVIGLGLACVSKEKAARQPTSTGVGGVIADTKCPKEHQTILKPPERVTH